MNYLISLSKPILHVWSGQLLKQSGAAWSHRENHHTAQFEIMLLEKGDLELSVNDVPVHLHAGQALLTPPYATVRGTETTTALVSQYWVHFFADYEPILDNDPRINQAATQHLTTTTVPILNDWALLPEQFTMHDPHHMFLLFRQLLQSANELPNSQRQNDFFLAYFLCSLSADYIQNLSSKNEHSSLASTQISEWVRTNISSQLTVQAVADHFELNASYLSRLFKREMGIPLKSYILNMKVDYAKYLLASTNLPIAKVSEQAYFTETKQFMHTFKERTSMTPSEYRDTLSKTHLNSESVDPKSQLPAQFGTRALEDMIYRVLKNHEL
jgi:AraC-like DNA-binding protein